MLHHADRGRAPEGYAGPEQFPPLFQFFDQTGSGPPEKVFNEFWKPSRGRLGARRGRKLLDDQKAVDLSLQLGV